MRAVMYKNLNSYLTKIDDYIARFTYVHEIGIFLVCSIFLGFGLHHLGQFITVDEEKWLYARIPQLYSALANGEWEQTYINDKPGIFPSLLAGIVTLFADIKDYQYDTIENFLFYWRLPIVLFNLGMILLIYRFLSVLLNKTYALVITSAVATNPTLIGLSQIVNPDATMWSSGAVSSIAYLLYLKTTRFRYVLIASLFLAFALLSKFAATYFFLIFYLVFIGGYILGFIENKKFGVLSFGWLVIVALSSFGYYLMFPAAWVNNSIFWKGTLGCVIIAPLLKPFAIVVLFFSFEHLLLKGRIFGTLRSMIDTERHFFGVLSATILPFIMYVAVKGTSDPAFFETLKKGYRGGAGFWDSLFANIYVFLTTVDIVTLVGLFTLLSIGVLQWFYKPLRNRITHAFYIVVAFILGFFYIFGLSLTGYYASSRYQMLTYSFYAIAGSIMFLDLTKKRFLVFIFVIAISFVELIHVSPFYFCYTNPLNVHNIIITDAWGFGGYEMAKWTNARFGKETKIWFDREGFAEFSNNDIYRWKFPAWTIPNLDYLVLSSRGLAFATQSRKGTGKRWETGPLLEYYDSSSLYQINIANNPNNYLKIVPFDRRVDKEVALTRAARIENSLGILSLAEPQTVSFWLRATDIDPGTPLIIRGSLRNSVNIGTTPNSLRFIYAEKGTGAFLDTGQIFDQKWHHIAWYHNGGKVGDEWGIYVDGRKRASSKVKMRKRGFPIVRKGKFKGQILKYQVFDSLLSSKEIEKLYIEQKEKIGK